MNAPPSLPCIFCGYDLSQSPREGLCPECGRAALPTFDCGLDTGTAWQTRRTLTAWLATACSMTFRPTETVPRIRMVSRDPPYQAWHIVLTALLAGAWPLVMLATIVLFSIPDPIAMAVGFIYAAMGFVLVLCAGIGVSLVEALVFRLWCHRKRLHPPRGLRAPILTHCTMPAPMMLILLNAVSAVLMSVCGAIDLGMLGQAPVAGDGMQQLCTIVLAAVTGVVLLSMPIHFMVSCYGANRRYLRLAGQEPHP